MGRIRIWRISKVWTTEVMGWRSPQGSEGAEFSDALGWRNWRGDIPTQFCWVFGFQKSLCTLLGGASPHGSNKKNI